MVEELARVARAIGAVSRAASDASSRPNVFISYSRRDAIDFAPQLVSALRAYGYEPSIDLHGIAGAERWQQRLGALILEADTVVFVLSPESCNSEVCAWEVAEAERLSKRLIPVIPQPLGQARVPDRLTGLNYIYFHPHPDVPGSGFGDGLARLVSALDNDLDWVRAHTRYLQRATEWESGGRADDRLLSGDDIRLAKDWLAQRRLGATEVTPLQLEFIRASEEAAAARTDARRRELEERERLVQAAEAAARGREAAVAAAEAATAERELAVERVARANRRNFRLGLATLAALTGVVSVSALAYSGLLDRNYLQIQARRLADIYRPTVLTAQTERALRPGATIKECASCPEMVVLPAGEFMMGSSVDEDEQPVHKVTIASPFAVSRFEATFDEWDGCLAHGGCTYRPGDNGWGRGRQPVINVSWQDAQAYVEWLSRLTGRRYRLLSEAEWEYAARGATTTAYAFGDEAAAIDEHAWLSANSRSRAHPVGSKRPNAFGLHDMHGNVSEIVQDCYEENYERAPADGSAVTTGDCTVRVNRGGSWGFGPSALRSAARDRSLTDYRVGHVGFRVARSLGP